MTVSGKYCETMAVMKWEGAEIGYLRVVENPPGSKAMMQGNQTATILQLASSDNAPPLTVERDVKVTVAFGTRPIDRNLIWLTAIRAMGDAAEKGLEVPVPSITTTGIRQTSWTLRRLDGFAVPVLRPGHSRIAIASTLAKMFKEQRFREVTVGVNVDGIRTAVGGFRQVGTGEDAAAVAMG